MGTGGFILRNKKAPNTVTGSSCDLPTLLSHLETESFGLSGLCRPFHL